MDYEKIVKAEGKNIAVKNKINSFRSFEDQINAQYSELKTTEATSRDSLRCGLLGYKMGMTHFWDKWGALIQCTVIQVDRCQVT